MKKYVAVAALALSFNAMALTVDMTISASQKALFKKSGDTFTQYYVEANGRFDMKVEEDGKVQSFGQDVPTEILNSDTISMTVDGKNRIKYIDTIEEINKIIPAKVKKSLTGKVKSIVVDSEVMVSLYSKSLEREGLSALSGLNVNMDELNLKTDFDFSNFSCSKKDDGLECTQDLSITIHADDNL